MRLRGAAACAAGLAAVGALVQMGATRPVDRFSLDRLRPLPGDGWQLVALPADAFVAGALVVALSVLVWRRDGLRAAWPWPAALAVALALEVAGKRWIAQIRFADAERIGSLVSLPGSFPSGHVCRSLLLAGTAVWLWPRLRRPAAGFVAYMVVVVVLTGMHVPSDVAGGLLLGGGLVLLAWELAERGRPRVSVAPRAGPVQAGERARSIGSA